MVSTRCLFGRWCESSFRSGLICQSPEWRIRVGTIVHFDWATRWLCDCPARPHMPRKSKRSKSGCRFWPPLYPVQYLILFARFSTSGGIVTPTLRAVFMLPAKPPSADSTFSKNRSNGLTTRWRGPYGTLDLQYQRNPGRLRRPPGRNRRRRDTRLLHPPHGRGRGDALGPCHLRDDGELLASGRLRRRGGTTGDAREGGQD